MKLDSPWFDRIRATRKSAEPEPLAKICDQAGCERCGGFRAPKGRGHEGQYWNFCFEHVRAYNHSYNYFADMPDDAVAAYQRDAATGHRPTWSMGVNPTRRGGAPRPNERRWHSWDYIDPFEFFDLGATTQREEPATPERRPIRRVERTSLDELGLDETATPAEIKSRFKLLVKRLHPDTNGGDRGTEDKLRAVIQAYTYLKQAGLC